MTTLPAVALTAARSQGQLRSCVHPCAVSFLKLITCRVGIWKYGNVYRRQQPPPSDVNYTLELDKLFIGNSLGSGERKQFSPLNTATKVFVSALKIYREDLCAHTLQHSYIYDQCDLPANSSSCKGPTLLIYKLLRIIQVCYSSNMLPLPCWICSPGLQFVCLHLSPLEVKLFGSWVPECEERVAGLSHSRQAFVRECLQTGTKTSSKTF